MFFMAREYHSFTVSVRVARLAGRNTPGTTQGPWARLSPLPICPTPRLDFSLRRGLAPAITKGDDGQGALSLAWRITDAMDLGPVSALTRGQGISLRLPSARRWAARDRAERAGTPGDGRSCRQVFMHVTAVVRDQAGMAGDSRGDAAATCKIAGIAYTGSNPVPATLLLSCGNAAVGPQVRPGSRVGFRSGFPPPDAPPTPPAHPAPLGRTRPRSSWPAGGRSGEVGGCTPAGRGRRRRHGAAGRR